MASTSESDTHQKMSTSISDKSSVAPPRRVPETVTSITARTLNPGEASKKIFEEQALGLKEKKIDADYEHAPLDEVAKRGRFPYRPSDLFLKMFAAAVDAADADPKTAVCSPSLLGSSGVCTLTIVSVIPDIMQHYHDIIVTAQKEVLIATNAWEPGHSVELVITALQELNERAEKEGRTVVVKVLMDAANLRNVFQARYDRDPSTWSKIGVPHEKLNNIDLDIINYHEAPLGTFHSKFAVIDRQVALVNSNNINIRSNVEMMCQFEGDIVNSIYDCFLVSWYTAFKNPPGLPCVSTPAVASRKFYFGKRNAFVDKEHNPEEAQAKTMDETHVDHEDHAIDPAHEVFNMSERYDKENHFSTARPINERLNVMEKAEETFTDHETDFAPFYFHTPHEPVPMAMVNRQPQKIPGHFDLHNPQNAVWLQGRSHLTRANAGLKLAKNEVFIHSPVFNASPVVQAVLDSCKRGVTVTLYIDLGFNDFAEGVVPFQGGTSDSVRKRMMEELSKCGKQQYLKWHWYVAKDQKAPLRFENQSRNNHVKFMQVDGQVSIMGSGNMDTQSWFHSQETNVMIDSAQLVKEWKEVFEANENTGRFGLTDEHGNLISEEPVPEKKGIGGLKRSQGGFL